MGPESIRSIAVDDRRCCRTSIQEMLARRHGAILGFAAMVEGATYDVPDWLPGLLYSLTFYVRERPPIGSRVQAIFKRWRHIHLVGEGQEFVKQVSLTTLPL